MTFLPKKIYPGEPVQEWLPVDIHIIASKFDNGTVDCNGNIFSSKPKTHHLYITGKDHITPNDWVVTKYSNGNYRISQATGDMKYYNYPDPTKGSQHLKIIGTTEPYLNPVWSISMDQIKGKLMSIQKPMALYSNIHKINGVMQTSAVSIPVADAKGNLLLLFDNSTVNINQLTRIIFEYALTKGISDNTDNIHSWLTKIL